MKNEHLFKTRNSFLGVMFHFIHISSYFLYYRGIFLIINLNFEFLYLQSGLLYFKRAHFEILSLCSTIFISI